MDNRTEQQEVLAALIELKARVLWEDYFKKTMAAHPLRETYWKIFLAGFQLACHEALCPAHDNFDDVRVKFMELHKTHVH